MQEVHEEGLQHVLAMMAEHDGLAALLPRDPVEITAAEAGAERAVGAAFRDRPLHHRIGVAALVALIVLQFVSGAHAFVVSRRARRAGVQKGNRLIALIIAAAAALGYASMDFLHHATGHNWRLFHLRAGSREPTLRVRDRLVASEGRRTTGTLNRGDIVTTVDLEGTTYIRRLIGLQGDRVQIKHGDLYMNGEAVPASVGERYSIPTPFGKKDAEVLIETLFGRPYQTLNLIGGGMADDRDEILVPQGHVFVLGDNRDNANDSRFVGPVAAEHISGIVYVI